MVTEEGWEECFHLGRGRWKESMCTSLSPPSNLAATVCRAPVLDLHQATEQEVKWLWGWDSWQQWNTKNATQSKTNHGLNSTTGGSKPHKNACKIFSSIKNNWGSCHLCFLLRKWEKWKMTYSPQATSYPTFGTFVVMKESNRVTTSPCVKLSTSPLNHIRKTPILLVHTGLMLIARILLLLFSLRILIYCFSTLIVHNAAYIVKINQ